MGIVDETGDHSENQQPLLLDMNCLSAKIKALSPLIDLLPGIARNDAVFRAYWCYYASDYRRRPQVFRRRLENADLIKHIKVRNLDDKSASLLDVLARIEDETADHEPITTVYNEFLKCFYQNLKGKPRKRTIVPDLKALELKEGEVCTALKKARNPYDIQQLKDELARIRQIRWVHHSPKMFHGTNQIQSPLKINESSFKGIKRLNKSLDARSTNSTISSDFSRNNRTALIRLKQLPVEQNIRKPISNHGKDITREVNGKKFRARHNVSHQPSAMFQSEERKHKTYNVHYKGENLHQIKQSSRKDSSSHHDETIPSIFASKILMQKADENKVKNIQKNKRRNGNQVHTDKAEQMIPQEKNIHKSNPHKPKDITTKKTKPTDKIKKIKHINAVEQKYALKESNKAASCKRLKPSSSQYSPMKQKEEQEKALEEIEPADPALSDNASRDTNDHKSYESFSTKPEIVLKKEDYKKLVELKENVPHRKGSEVDNTNRRISTNGSISNEPDKKKNNIQIRKSNSSLTSTHDKKPKYNRFKFKEKKSLQMQYFYQTKRSSLYKNIVPIHRFIEELTRAKTIRKHSDSDVEPDLHIEALQNSEVTEALLNALTRQGLLNKVSLDSLLRHSDPNYEGKSLLKNAKRSSSPDTDKNKLLPDKPRRSTIGSQASYSPTDLLKYKASSAKLNAYQVYAKKLSATSISSDTSHGREMCIAKAPKKMSKRISQMVEEFIKEPNMEYIFGHLYPAMINSSTSTSDSEDSPRLLSKPRMETKYEPCSICRQLQKHPSNLKPYMQQMESQRKRMELGNYYRQMMTRNCQQKRKPDVRKRIEPKRQHCSILKKLQNILPVHNHYDYWKSSPFY